MSKLKSTLISIIRLPMPRSECEQNNLASFFFFNFIQYHARLKEHVSNGTKSSSCY